MAKAKEKIAADEAAPVAEPILTEEAVKIEYALLFERIPEYRFVDKDGRWFRLELKSSGVYWAYPV